MAKTAVFTMKLEAELREAFMAAVKRDDRPASQVVREFMRGYVQQDREYVAWLRRKVERSHQDVAAGRIHTDEEVQAEMDQLIADLEDKGREAAE